VFISTGMFSPRARHWRLCLAKVISDIVQVWGGDLHES
jgi:hypothetical protein